jgi:hypothetical protein
MTLYRGTCAYLDLDGEIYTDTKVVEADSKKLAGSILSEFFRNKHDVPNAKFLFSTPKEVTGNTTIATGDRSVAIGGRTGNTVINNGNGNIVGNNNQFIGANTGTGNSNIIGNLNI